MAEEDEVKTELTITVAPGSYQAAVAQLQARLDEVKDQVVRELTQDMMESIFSGMAQPSVGRPIGPQTWVHDFPSPVPPCCPSRGPAWSCLRMDEDLPRPRGRFTRPRRTIRLTGTIPADDQGRVWLGESEYVTRDTEFIPQWTWPEEEEDPPSFLARVWDRVFIQNLPLWAMLAAGLIFLAMMAVAVLIRAHQYGWRP